MHCDHTVHLSTSVSLWLDSAMFGHLTPKHVHLLPAVFFQFHLEGRWVRMCKLGMISQERLKIEVKLVLSANRKSYMPRRLAQQQMTLSDLEWHHPNRALSLQ